MEEIIVQITLKDALITAVGSRMPSPYTCKILLKAPENWTVKGNLIEEGKEKFFQTFYGPDWKNGNSDGSRYSVSEYEETTLVSSEAIKSAWEEVETQSDPKVKWWFNRVDEEGKVVTCEKNEIFSE